MHHYVYRRCPKCEETRRASEFARSDGGTPPYGADRPMRCPACGCVAPLRVFKRTAPAGAAQNDGAVYEQ